MLWLEQSKTVLHFQVQNVFDEDMGSGKSFVKAVGRAGLAQSVQRLDMSWTTVKVGVRASVGSKISSSCNSDRL
jgi:hypothetical protein